MIIKITPDREKAKSILKLIREREEFISAINHEKFTTNAVENYYEIIKELASSLILLDGFKSIGDNAHKDLIDSLINYNGFSEEDIIFLSDLRIKRNNSSYEVKKIDPIYLKNNKNRIIDIIEKLKKEVNRKLIG